MDISELIQLQIDAVTHLRNYNKAIMKIARYINRTIDKSIMFPKIMISAKYDTDLKCIIVEFYQMSDSFSYYVKAETLLDVINSQNRKINLDDIKNNFLQDYE